jgi:type IV pilus assembly protein PilA
VLTAIRKRLEDREEGFTLIELLVVVIIIGILAAIAIPTFLNQRQRGWDAAAQAELRNAAVVQETYFTDENTYATLAQLQTEGFNLSDNMTVTVIDADSDFYCMSAQHDAQTGTEGTFYISSDSGSPTETACVADAA